MYDFIVLGIIPGTHTQLGFYGLLLVISAIIAVLSVIATIYRLHKVHVRRAQDYNQPRYYDIISI